MPREGEGPRVVSVFVVLVAVHAAALVAVRRLAGERPERRRERPRRDVVPPTSRAQAIAVAGLAALVAVVVLRELGGVLAGMRPADAAAAGIDELTAGADRFRAAVRAWLDHEGELAGFGSALRVVVAYFAVDTIVFVPAYVVLLGALIRAAATRAEVGARMAWTALAVGALSDVVENLTATWAVDRAWDGRSVGWAPALLQWAWRLKWLGLLFAVGWAAWQLVRAGRQRHGPERNAPPRAEAARA